ncbi:hypothetical protein TruAng_006180 [Truncatella angustata]|nr:hypothetical protein TruAng_006180 [Truncatella angustata]
MMAIPSETINKASPLPPKASSALPGRNVKPLPRQPEVQTTVAPPKPPKDSPTQKSEAAPLSAQPAKATMSAASPLSSPEPPAKSIRRREVGSKTSTQPMQAQQEASPAQHLREARSAISLRSEAERSERIQREAAQEKFPEELQQFQESAAAAALSSPRARRPSNPPQAPRLAAAPQLTVTSPRARAAPRVPVEYKDQEPLQLTPQEERSLSDAISRVVNRENWNWAQASPNKQGVWPCKELTSDHIACLSDHRRWLHMENSSVPIACMLCHEGERGHRRLCKTCGIRVCVGCADVLTGRKIGELDFDSLAGKTQDMGKSKGVATAAQ